MYLYRVRRADCIGCHESPKEPSIHLYPQMLIYSFQGIRVVDPPIHLLSFPDD
jgi:hypothetical protein